MRSSRPSSLDLKVISSSEPPPMIGAPGEPEAPVFDGGSEELITFLFAQADAFLAAFVFRSESDQLFRTTAHDRCSWRARGASIRRWFGRADRFPLRSGRGVPRGLRLSIRTIRSWCSPLRSM